MLTSALKSAWNPDFGRVASRTYLNRLTPPLRLDEADWITLNESLSDHLSLRWLRQRYPRATPRTRCNSVQMVEGPVAELENDMWMLAHPDVRRLQRVRLLFDFCRENLVL